MGVANDTLSRKGSHNTQRGNHNGICRVNRFANSSSAGEAIDNHLSMTKDRPRSIQLTKILEAIPLRCQYNHYDYISDIISTKIEPTQEEPC